ncbi:ABC transporter permease [Alteromonas gracilis]|uniref:ABC transporter permease n=1 Tax=Alteromonas gracilis TaxID=1479524 RepID=UPI00373542D4
MFSNYILIAWRNIVKKPLFSAINIVGLAIGLMSCILIMLFVRSESGYDAWMSESDRVVRLHTAYHTPGRPSFLTVRSAGMVMPAVRDFMANEVEVGARLFSMSTTIRKDGEGFEDNVLVGEEYFFELFDLPLAHGSIESSFAKPNDLLVTEETAIRYFGRTDVVGETLTLCCVAGRPIELAISGVLKDLPENTHFNISMLVYMDVQLFSSFDGLLNTWNSVNVYSYFKLREGVSLQQAQARLDYWINNESPYAQNAKDAAGVLNDRKVTDSVELRFMPLEDLHLHAHKHAGNLGDFSELGNDRMVFTFSFVAILILLIACVNFMNLSTARAGLRAREVAMRKVLGASRSQVAVQFLVEAICLVFIALLLALVGVEVTLPFYNYVLDKSITFDLLSSPDLFLLLAGIVLIVGLGAGSYPALVISRYMPGRVLKASESSDSGASSTLRSALVVGQFVISIGLLISTSVVYLQTQHANNMDLGYTSDNKLVLNIGAARDNRDALKSQIEAIPDVTGVSYSSEAPSQDNENNTNFTRPGFDNNEPVTALLNYYSMGYGFFDDYEVTPIAGRVFNKANRSDVFVSGNDDNWGKGSIILNRSAVTKLGFDSPESAIGAVIHSGYGNGMSELTIVGVIPDIYFRSVKFDIRPSVYLLDPNRFSVATISYSSSYSLNKDKAVREAVEQVWRDVVPLEPVNIRYLSDMLERQYQQENAQMKLLSAFAVLAIAVACLGLYGLAAFSAQRRTKEIGIRKVMGASVSDIVKLLVWQFTQPVALANIIAWPVAVWLMLSWLQQFPYRIDFWLLIPICIGSGAISVAIAWITVGGNAARVARYKPIKALRHE